MRHKWKLQMGSAIPLAAEAIPPCCATCAVCRTSGSPPESTLRREAQKPAKAQYIAQNPVSKIKISKYHLPSSVMCRECAAKSWLYHQMCCKASLKMMPATPGSTHPQPWYTWQETSALLAELLKCARHSLTRCVSRLLCSLVPRPDPHSTCALLGSSQSLDVSHKLACPFEQPASRNPDTLDRIV